MQRPRFNSPEEYAEKFTDWAVWQPYVEHVCQKHQLSPSEPVRVGLPGTNAVFLVREQIAIKFYTPFFGGASSFPAELALYRLFAPVDDFPVPKLVAHGELFDEEGDWKWPYIVTSVIPGTSLGEIEAQVVYEDKVVLASWLGKLLYRLHSVPPSEVPHLKHSASNFHDFLAGIWAERWEEPRLWGKMPQHLRAQVVSYLRPLDWLVGPSAGWSILHCDLNEDHVLGEFVGGQWQPNGIIDFGDARVGDPLYEFGALHLGLFHCDKQLLRAFLESYGAETPVQDNFAQRAMNFALLHEFRVVGAVFERFPLAATVRSWEELADLLWDIDKPGLESLSFLKTGEG